MNIPTISFTVVTPGAANEPSWFDLKLTASSAMFGAAGTLLDAWCLDFYAPFRNAPANQFTSPVYPGSETGLVLSSMPILATPDRSAYVPYLDSISWLLNHYDGTNYPYALIQFAIWELVGQPLNTLPAAYQTFFANQHLAVDQLSALVAAARAQHGLYVPAAGESMVMVVDPRWEGVEQQPLVIEVKAAQLGDFVWHDRNADGTQDSGEVGIAGVVVNLVRDMDGDGKFESTGELIATTTTDATGHYTFKGLAPGYAYQVEFVTPSGYAAASPRQADGLSGSGVNSDGPLSDVVVLAPGENNITLDSGFYQTASIGDKVWEDKNGDGKQDTNEGGVANVTVELYNCATNLLVATTTTDASGNYLFSGLKPGTYHVKFITPSGYTLTTIDVGDDAADSDADARGITGCYTLTSGEKNTTVDAGLIPKPASLGDKVWHDKDGDGIQDADEPGVAGVKVELYRCAANGRPAEFVKEAVTGPDGAYLFDKLEPGTYHVRFYAPDRTEFTTLNVGANDAVDSDANSLGITGCYTLAAGDQLRTVDAGVVCTPNVGDRVWLDTDADGIQDSGEAGVAGLNVRLVGAGLDGSFGTSDDTLRATTTDSAGNYLFEKVRTGQYKVEFEVPVAYRVTTADVGSDDAGDSDATLTKAPVNLIVNGSFEADNLGPQAAFFNDLVGWKAVNNVTELQWAPGWGVTGSTGTTVVELDSWGTTTTTGYGISQAVKTTAAQAYNLSFDAAIRHHTATATNTFDVFWNGAKIATIEPNSTAMTNFKFTVVGTGGNDELKFMVPPGSNDGIGAYLDNVSLSVSGTASTAVFTVGCEDDLTRDMGLVSNLKASYGDRVWEDGNMNGIQDAGEQGIAGVTVKLFSTAGMSAVLGTAVTGADGSYLFTNLVAGAGYFAEFTAPTGYLRTLQDTGGDDAKDSDIDSSGRTTTTTLDPGEIDLTWDAGFYRKASLGDFVWTDADRDGVQDGGEKGIGGVLVRLRDVGADGIAYTGDDNHIRDTTTAVDGSYKFSDLNPGAYYVQVFWGYGLDKATQEITNPNQGGDDAQDSDMRVPVTSDGMTHNSETVTLKSGEHNPTLDIGVIERYACLGDYVWFDKNANGHQDTGELGAVGVVVTLTGAGLDNTWGTADDILKTQVTVDGGKYKFTELDKGQYQVQFSNLPAGFGFTNPDRVGDTTDSDADRITGKTPIVTLKAGEENLTLDAGLVQTASYGDRVWEDTNMNGVQDAGEQGIAGVTVTLRDGSNTVVGTQVTDSNGKYQFTNLVPGSGYCAEFTAPSGYVVTSQDKGGNDTTDSDISASTRKTIATDLSAGEVDLSWDAGFYRKASLGDFVWTDADRDGVQDGGEKGIGGVLVRLRDVGADGIAYTGDDNHIRDTTTAVDGSYKFSDLNPGAYYVQVFWGYGLDKATQEITNPNQGGDDAQDSDMRVPVTSDGMTHNSETVTLKSGEHNPTLDIGVIERYACLGDYVWFDKNANGHQDTGELGAVGVVVTLTGAGLDNTWGTADDILKTQVTVDGGKYKFTELDKGQYQVQFSNLPAGFGFTNPDRVGDTTDSDADRITGKTPIVTLKAGEENLTLDAGLVQTASYGDRVWEDTNMNGVQDAGEQGIAGVTVTLRDGSNTVVGTQVTDSNGKYQFTNLVPGSGYCAEFTAPSGYVVTSQDKGGNDTTDSDISASTRKTIATDLSAGEVDLSWDAGFYRKASLGDFVWTDADRDGVQDGGEKGIGGVLVRLRDVGADGIAYTGDDNHIRDTTTAVDGSYKFSDLNPGAYYVQVFWGYGLDKATQEITNPNQGGDDAQDSDMRVPVTSDGMTHNSETVTLKSGEHNPTLDIGVVERLGSLGDFVWYDKNNDGVQNDGAGVGARNVLVELYGAGGDGKVNTTDDVFIASQRTNADGKYLFEGLDKGTYQVRFSDLPIGYDFTKRDIGGNDTLDSDAFISTGRTDAITLAAGQSRLDVDAGLVTEAALGDYVWWDLNANGRQDSNEEGVADVLVILTEGGADKLFGTADDTQQSVRTNANGRYHFYDLTPGVEYRVRFMAPTDMAFTQQDVGGDGGDSDAERNGTTAVVKLAAFEQNFTIDAGLVRTDGTRPDEVAVCEDRSVTFNVLGNDPRAVKLLSIAHETAALDATFKANAGALSFTENGSVTYKTMTNYYGFDKLVYTAMDATGQVYRETVDVTVRAVSDGPTVTGGGATYHWDNAGGWQFYGTLNGKTTWIHNYSAGEFGTFSDSADKLQQFGTYNTGVADDADTLKVIRLYGIQENAQDAKIQFDGVDVDFSNGRTFDVTLSDIKAGKLDLFITKAYVNFPLKWAFVDTGAVQNDACYNGSIISNSTTTTIWTPIALDLDDDGKIGVTGATSSYQKDADAALGRTVQFDIDADGKKDIIEWFNGSGDGILIDNRDGLAAHDMDGARLFGDQGGAHGNGYYKLEQFDTNGDGKLSGKELAGIELWVDDGDALVQAGEIQTLAQHGITELSTQLAMTYDSDGKLHIQSTATRADGSQILSEDVYFAGVASMPGLADLVTNDGSLDALLGAEAPIGMQYTQDVAVDQVGEAAEILRRIAAAQAASEAVAAC